MNTTTSSTAGARIGFETPKGSGSGQGNWDSKASLSVVDKVDGIELDKLAGKPKETNQAVVDLLGLTSEQFKQIILLPQYQFQPVSQSRRPVRKFQFCDRFFGTQVFAKFEDDLAQKWSQARQEQSQLQAKLMATSLVKFGQRKKERPLLRQRVTSELALPRKTPVLSRCFSQSQAGKD
nr:hypothetical protein [Streptococcus downei]